MKFKVGDKVRVIASQAELKDIHCDLVSREVYLVEETDPDDDHLTYKLDEDALGVWVKEDMIELAEKLPLKRDDKITLELTGEQVFWIALLTGRTNGGWDQKKELYETTHKMLNDFCYEALCTNLEHLWSSREAVEKALEAAFPPEQVEPEIEELTLEQVCKELGRDVKIIK